MADNVCECGLLMDRQIGRQILFEFRRCRLAEMWAREGMNVGMRFWGTEMGIGCVGGINVYAACVE